MKYRQLGKTGFMVSEVSMGGLFVGKESHETGIQTVRRALEIAVNVFDTAPSYLNGKAQEIL